MQIINGFRLSPQQKYLWKLQQDSAAYWAQCAILLEGDIKTDILKKALQNVIERFEILRTSFPRQPGVKFPVQAIASSSIPAWHFVNFNGGDRDIDAKIEELFQEERGVSFDGEKPPIRRITLIKLSEIRQILIVSLPSLCADSWTIENLVKELSQSYVACLEGQEVSDEVVQYVQFSEWQNQLLEDEDAEAGKTYWLQQNLSEFANLKLPFERQQPDRLGKFELNFFEKKISSSVGEKIEAVAREYQISPSVFLLACWKTLLWRLTGKSEIVVARSFAGRNYEELEPAFGLFAKYLPLRTHLEENKLFSEILQQIQTAEADAIEWQEYFSGEEIGSSILPFGFEFEERSEKYSAGEVSFSTYKKYVCFDKFKIKLSCHCKDEAIAAEFQYDPGWIAAEGIHCLAEQFQALVESAANNPETAVNQLEILSDVQRHQVLVEFNHTKADYPINKCIHELFEEQVKKTPNQIAVVFENQQFTYAELNAKANKIARHLQKIGVKSEEVVGFCIERSLESIIGLLGILKAGGAYLPLDPALPKQRIALTLQDSQATVLLTQQHLTEVVSDMPVQVVYLESEAIASESEENPTSGAIPNHLVYILYTSGSTGTPKGVAVEHQQLVNYFNGIVERLELPQKASFATVSTLAADLGNTAIFPALLTGGCLHIIASDRISDPDAIAEYFRQNAIDCLKIVPSHLEALLSGSHPENILPRKRLILGGESCSWALIDKVQKLAPDCTIFNHYGPTEATVGATTYRVEKDGNNRFSATVPIGRPIGNVQIYLLDDRAQPVAIGVAGKVYIGGSGIARGYLNRPELTAEKFVSNPFANELGEKLYKTGDRARYLSDGNIEFLGRLDNQVKIRGFRIELGEIEAVLGTHPTIRQSAVVVREDTPDNKYLVAYVVTSDPSALDATALRNFLKQQLPDYMVPGAIAFLNALPLTSNGKVDRKALLAVDFERNEMASNFAAPRTPTEEAIATIWAEVLGVERIGIYDNFFELGGHSLLATRVISKLRNSFALEIPLRRLFENPTVADLAVAISQLVAAEETTDEEIAGILGELEGLSDEEVQQLLADQI